MTVEIVVGSVSWRNLFPAEDGISTYHSPHTIVTGLQADYNNHCHIEVGTYSQTHEEHDNTMKTRTVGAIALRTTGNSQRGYFFLSLAIGRRIERRSWTELPIPEEVIERVHALVRRRKSASGLTFGWRDGSRIVDDNVEKDHNDRNRWELPNLRYHSIRDNYHYPFWGVIFFGSFA